MANNQIEDMTLGELSSRVENANLIAKRREDEAHRHAVEGLTKRVTEIVGTQRVEPHVFLMYGKRENSCCRCRLPRVSPAHPAEK